MEHATQSLTQLAVEILNTGDATQKAELTQQAADAWRNNKIAEIGCVKPNPKPERPSYVKILAPRDMPKRGKAGNEQNRIAMIHSLVHIESVAIDLSWDLIARFADYDLPREFFDDWVKVAEDEARHYSLLLKRLKQMGSDYGALPAHEGLWQSASDTAHDLMARLAIEHMVHEARGIDVTPKTIEKFRNAKDEISATLLEEILRDEQTHVTAGIKWFTFLCKRMDPPKETIPYFHETVRKYFHGGLKPPFNTTAREEAGMTEEWYLPLVNKPKEQQ
jgi:uncharacterized ferritin-like protein (DUF455 family)